jgi:hypothetical protein
MPAPYKTSVDAVVPAVSVVLPVYNSEPYLAEAFDSTAGQRQAITREVMAAEAGAAARASLPTRTRLAVAVGVRHIPPTVWFEPLGRLMRRMPAGGPA